MMYSTSPTCQIPNLSELYMQHFGYKTDGVFVEVGAHDGYSFSNSWGLAVAGWRGLYFEPVPALYEACVTAHKDHHATVINACVGNYCGDTILWLTDNPTIDEETMRLSPFVYSSGSRKYDPDDFMISPIVTLNYQLATLSWPEEFDVLGIDVEGGELQVLEGIDFMKWKPTLVIIETCELHPDPRLHFHTDKILAHMAMQPYEKIWADTVNTIWKRTV